MAKRYINTSVPATVAAVTLFSLALLLFATYCLLQSYFALPTVYKSTATNKCVRCVDCDCTDLPDKYILIWVK